MEEIIEMMKEDFKKYQIKGINNQIAYACGYLKENEDVTRRQAVEIIRRIIFEKI